MTLLSVDRAALDEENRPEHREVSVSESVNAIKQLFVGLLACPPVCVCVLHAGGRVYVLHSPDGGSAARP